MKQKHFILICLFFISITRLFSQIVNEGVLQIESGIEIYFGDEYTNKHGANHNNNGDLYVNHNFNNNGTTTSASGTTFFKSATNAIQTISGSTKEIHFYNLEIDNSGAGVSVEDNFGLFVENTVDLTAGDLRLQGEAQLIQTNNVSNLGAGNLLRDQQGISTIYGYNYWSSPVHTAGSFSLGTSLLDGTDVASSLFNPSLINYITGLDGSTSPTTLSTRWIYTYTPSVNGYSGWIKRNQNSNIAIGTGYSIKGTGAVNQNYVFKGVPNNGDYSFAIADRETALLGNPYPSAIDANQFIEDNDDTGVVNEIYFWIDGGSDSHYSADYKGGYATRNITAGAPATEISGTSGLGIAAGKIPGRYIAVGQGFFIDATATGTINFKNSQRAFETEALGNSEFLKPDKKSSSAEKGTNLSENSIIRIGYKNPKDYHRQIVLGFVPNSHADINFNIGYDAIMADPKPDELFFIIENDVTKKYVIQGVGSYDDSIEISLGLMMTEEGEHTIMLDAVENFTETVYLRDNLLNTTYNLSEANFNIDLNTGNYFDRYSVVFKASSNETLAVELENLRKEKIVVFYNNNNSVIVKNEGIETIKSIRILNSIGQNMLEINKNLAINSEISIPFNFIEGVYLVLVETNLGRETFKIVK